jgi:phosphatidylglycerol lysyltransferase
VSDDTSTPDASAPAPAGAAAASVRGGEFGWRVFVDAMVPPVAAVACFVIGVLLIFSAAQPSLPARMEALLAWSGVAVAELSHLMASMVGMLLLFLAAGIWRRIDAAYWMVLALLVAGAGFTLLKGLHWEESLMLALAALALLPFRASFYRQGHLTGNLLSVPSVLAMLAVAGIAVGILLAAYRDVPYTDDLWWTFLGDSDAPRSMRALAAAVVGGLLVAGWQVAGVRQTGGADAGDLTKAAAIFASAPEGHADANLMFSGDKSFVFAPSGRSFVMYRPRGGLWVSMGNPVGDPGETVAALTAFHEAADRAGKSPVIYAAGGDLLPALVELGYVIRKIGETACVDVQAFSLQGPARARLRQANNRQLRDGWTVEVIPAGGAAPWEALKRVSDAWLADQSGREKSFSLGRFDLEYLSRFPVALVRKPGAPPVAFASLWPGPGGREIAVDLMRHTKDAPNGVMEFLFIGLLDWAKAQGFQTLDLGMAPLSGMRAGRFSPALSKIGQIVYDQGESLYGFRGLRAYKSKFQPDWRPLFIAAPPRVSLPVALAAVALLTSGGVRGLLGFRDG